MARRGGRRRCPADKKTTFTSWKAAKHVAIRMPDEDNRIYWCKAAGGYHITRLSVEEYERRRAMKRFEEEASNDDEASLGQVC